MPPEPRAPDAMVKAMKRLRTMLPGDPEFGDQLSTGGEEGAEVLARRLAEATSERPSLLREAGLSALQVWQAMGDSQRARVGEKELVIVFTDLVDFSRWALAAGDATAVELLRGVVDAIEPPIVKYRGNVVKRLGDGMMAVFDSPDAAVDALIEGKQRLDLVRADGYAPRIRAGLHVGYPRKVGSDYLGVDVNVAARIADAAGSGQILASESVISRLDPERFRTRRKLLFRAKGVPADVTVYAVKTAR